MTADETQVRLARLERDHRRLRTAVWIGAVVLLAVALGVVESFRERNDLWQYGLETNYVTVHDRAGREVVLLGEYVDRPYLKFLDATGHERMFLALEESGMAFTFSDSDGRPRLRMSMKEAGGQVEILDAGGQRVWSAP